MEGKAGHGAGKPMAKIVAQYTDEFSFLFAELGISVP
jgi:prolyl oligopeptidase PreP (S9A serine peptidase family)